jgi:cold shock protein
MLGKIKFWNVNAGWGFVVPDDGGPDVFVHVKNVVGGDCGLMPNERVSFDEGESPKHPGRREAKNVRLLPEAA